ncbi:class I SAM-dependent methyltransferase [Glycomyces halotolerans]
MVGEWAGYLGRFHEERAGITERVLARSFDGGQHPYEWLAGAVSGGPVVDAACGSAPLYPLLGDLGYLGVDNSAGELRLARKRGTPVVLASVTDLPAGEGSVGTVVCSMAMQVVDGLDWMLAEVARVLRPGGRLVATVPAAGPLRVRDRCFAAGLFAAIGRSVTYPNDAALRAPSDLVGAAGLTLVGDERRRFVFRLRNAEDAELLVRSLYLPGLSRRRLGAALRWARAWARIGREVPIPVRRLIATR